MPSVPFTRQGLEGIVAVGSSIRLEVERMAYGADAIAHADDGKTVFVSGGITGDVVEARVVSDGPSFARAEVTEVLEPSPLRVAPSCPYTGICGGCPWAALSREAQLAAKRANVVDSLVRIGHMDQARADALVGPCEAPSDPWGYRNKVELAFTRNKGRAVIGMHDRGGSNVIKVDRCPLLDARHAKLVKSVSGALSYLSGSHELGIDRIGDYAARFGLAQKTGLELSEKTGIMAGPAYTESLGGTWYDGSTLSVAIGQESSQFTPIQLANYIATLVNGGTRNATHLLKEVKSHDYSSILETYQPEVLSTVEIEAENMQAVKAGMLMLTTQGSVRKYFQGLDFQVGAKTGSAQVSASTQSHAVFVCFAPYENPEVAMAIVVEHGGSGGELAAIASDVLSYYFSARETQELIPEENTLIR
jgi:predicted RNA-binding protein with TRAM domain